MTRTLSLEQRARLAELEVDGRLTPDIVLADAESLQSPLHALFEWDTSVAARKYRLQQARQILRIRYVSSETTVSLVAAPCYVRDPSQDGATQGYINVARLKTDVEAAREVMRSECARAEAALTRARVIAEVLGVHEELDHLLDRVAMLRQQVMLPLSESAQDQASA